MSKKVFITKSTSAIPWGFCIQGGIDVGRPITVYKVYESSTAYGKLDPGCIITEIAGVGTETLTHDQALDVIKKCNNALFLTVVNPPSDDETQKLDEVKQEEIMMTTDVNEPPVDSNNPSFFIPKPPPMNALQMRQKYVRNSIRNESEKRATELEPKTLEEHVVKMEETNEGTRIPERLLSTMTKPGMKPFTYTPRGIDLDEVMERARARMKLHRRIYEESGETDQKAQYDQECEINKSTMRSSYYDTEAVTQSRSFQKLQGWIDNSAQIPVKQHFAPASMPTERFESIPSKAFSKLQMSYEKQLVDQDPILANIPASKEQLKYEPQRINSSAIPSKSFKLLEQYTIPPDTKRNLAKNIYNNSQEIRKNDQEWKSTVPSKTFRMLQRISLPDSTEKQ
ncbi:hypothetical protein ACOME3_008992 [Neoechinorhynchus agilis]